MALTKRMPLCVYERCEDEWLFINETIVKGDISSIIDGIVLLNEPLIKISHVADNLQCG